MMEIYMFNLSTFPGDIAKPIRICYNADRQLRSQDRKSVV